jgi:YD repeat-containing protein
MTAPAATAAIQRTLEHVEDASEPVAFSYVEAGDLPRINDRWGQRVQWAGVGDALMR